MVDCTLDRVQTPHGPIKIGTNRQITLPAALMRQIDLEPHDSVYVAMAEDAEGTLMVIPVEKLVGWIDAGRRREEPRMPVEDTDSL